jgi:hypothetical protein
MYHIISSTKTDADAGAGVLVGAAAGVLDTHAPKTTLSMAMSPVYGLPAVA